MSKFPFDFPLGIQPWPRELRIYRRRMREGYQFAQLENSSDCYRLTAMAGAGKIPALLHDFARVCLGNEAFLILEFYQDEWQQEDGSQPPPTVFYSPYLPTDELLEVIEPYMQRLIHDGFVGFGLANNRLGMELFYSEEKMLTCFTGNQIQVMDLFARHGLPHNPQQLFPADFGHDHLSLQCHGRQLPPFLAGFSRRELDYLVFCNELTEQLDMYPVEESLSFFLSRKEQDLIEQHLRQHDEFAAFAEEDFGALILDWNDFVDECSQIFEGDLWEYQQGLKLRDMLQYVIEAMPGQLRQKLQGILADPDERFRKALVDRRKRLHATRDVRLHGEQFWYQGVVRNQGSSLRRDLIRHGWYKS
ncbi:hypothetical protein C2E25_14000 [Geothermobacter hydrogeniphilus]|uniref:Uncharacterized protein n=1 Tax=Geothermobacter hydrogeniphilus TaxID=1969733 RepID=A0A2K2H728_9BACT|nr:hypothetical protein [Geothermobacter hydrogeniphilus]PNU19108.1 hypothetical protein C2E25_14000 [Geothermobacter hydrogeniphilus]